MMISFVASCFYDMEIKDLNVNEVIIGENIWNGILKVSNRILGTTWDKKYLWGAKIIVNKTSVNSVTVKNLDNNVVITRNKI